MRDRASWSPGTWRAPVRIAAKLLAGWLGGLLGRRTRCPATSSASPVTTSAPAEAGITWSIRAHRPRRSRRPGPGLEALSTRPARRSAAAAGGVAGRTGRADGCADLPQALIHPDFPGQCNPPTPDKGLVLVDSTAAGRGDPLAFLLGRPGCAGPSRLDAVVAGYREHVCPGTTRRTAGWRDLGPPADPGVLDGPGRPEGAGRDGRGLAAGRELAERFAAQAAQAFRAAPATGAAPAPPAPRSGLVAGARRHRVDHRGHPSLWTARPTACLPTRWPRRSPKRAGWTRSAPGVAGAVALRVWVVARALFLDDLLAEAGQQGCRQVVLLGAGSDAPGYRLPWPPGARCFEVATRDVLGPKDQVLAAEHAVPGCERLVVPCDLRVDWPAALRAAGPGPGPADRVDRQGPARLPHPGGGRRAAGHDRRPPAPGSGWA